MVKYEKSYHYWFTMHGNNDEACLTTSYSSKREAAAGRARTIKDGRLASKVFLIKIPKLKLTAK